MLLWRQKRKKKYLVVIEGLPVGTSDLIMVFGHPVPQPTHPSRSRHSTRPTSN